MKAIRLKAADLSNPIGIDIVNPRFTWNCEGGEKQKAYRVVVKDNTETVLFDSGKVEESHMYCIYDGAKLKSRTKAKWQVCLWDENGEEAWSDSALFEIGLLEKNDFSAKWIHGIDTDKEEHLPADYYQKTFRVKSNVKYARLYATAFGVYTAHINGICVSSVLAPGTTQYDKTLHYQTYDVTAVLKENTENELLFAVADGWYKGKLGADQNEYLFGKQTKLFAQLEIEYVSGEKTIIATDENFLWSNDGPIRFADLKDGEIYDARKELVFCEQAVVDDAEKTIPTASNAPLICEQEEFAAMLEMSRSGKQILNFGQNMAGYLRFHVNEPEGTEIVVRLFEATDHGEYSDASLSFPNGNVETVKQEIRFIASGKAETYKTAFFYAGFQYALVEGIKDLKPEDFTAIAVYSDLEYYGNFSCSNEKINKFVSNTIWSMKSNFVDVPTDCPQREKAGWTGDAQVFCKTANYFADTKAFYRKWFRDIADCQRENGLIVDVNPRVSPTGTQRDMVNGSCGWADAAIIIPYTLWKMTGDSCIIRDNYSVMHGWKEYMMHICQHKSMFAMPEGHPLKQAYDMCKLPDSEWNCYIPEYGIHWGEWCVPESQEPSEFDPAMALILPKQEVTCAYTHYSMTLLAEMLHEIGYEEEAAECMKYAKGSKEAYHVHWVKNGTIDTNHMAELVRPIALGLLTEEEKKLVAEKLNEMVISRNYKVGTGFLSTPFLLQTLAENGYLNSAYRMLENEEAPGWLAMVAQGATTVWEEYECYSSDGTPLPHSFNHYSPGAVCNFLFDTVCGIRIVGENAFMITPKVGGTLEFAKAETMTAYGPVKSQWMLEGECAKFEITIPANTTATIILPNGEMSEVKAGTHCFFITL